MSEPLALITGANRGLGLGVCLRLGRAGMRVVAACRDADAAARTASDLERQGLRAEPLVLDVTRADHVRSAAAALRDRGLDVLVNNAGISMKGFNSAVVEGTLAVNYRGAVHVTEALLPAIRDGGRIVMVSSTLGELSAFSQAIRERFLDPALRREKLDELVGEFERDVGEGRHAERGWPTSAYRVSKAAMNAYTRILAPEIAARGILVNAVCPGWVRTKLGGEGAPRDVATGAESIAWAALIPDGGPSGGFFRDGVRIPW